MIRDRCDRYTKAGALSFNKGRTTDDVREIADECARGRRMGNVGMKWSGCRNVYEKARGGSCRIDGKGVGGWRGKSMVQTIQCIEGKKMWKGDLACTRMNKLELYRDYHSG